MGDMERRDYGVLLWGDGGKGCVPGGGWDFVRMFKYETR